jgi:hypothetical protein
MRRELRQMEYKVFPSGYMDTSSRRVLEPQVLHDAIHSFLWLLAIHFEKSGQHGHLVMGR